MCVDRGIRRGRFLFLGSPGLMGPHVTYDVIAWQLLLSSGVFNTSIWWHWTQTSLYVCVFMSGTRVDSYMYNMQNTPTPKSDLKKRRGK